MAQRFARTLVRRAREHPLALLSGLVGMSLEIAALWLLSGIWGHAGIDRHSLALEQALGSLGSVFMLLMFWTMPIRFSRNEPARENTASRGVRRAAAIVWGIVLVLALSQLVAALSSNLGYAAGLGFAVASLNLIAVIGGLVVRASAAGRQR